MDLEFKKHIMSIIKESEATFGIAITDLKSKNMFLYNADEVFPAASVIKIPIFIELLRQVQAKKVKLKTRVALKQADKVGGAGVLNLLDDNLKPTVADLARLMIIISDNTASNMIIDIIGMQSVNNMMRKLGIVKTVLGRKLNIDPSALQYKNFTTARDIMFLLEKIYDDKFLKQKYRDMMIDIMLKQQNNKKISKNFPKSIRFAHKTGEISVSRHDAGIVLNIDNPFIIAVLAKGVKNPLKTDEVMSKIGDLTLKYLAGEALGGES